MSVDATCNDIIERVIYFVINLLPNGQKYFRHNEKESPTKLLTILPEKTQQQHKS